MHFLLDCKTLQLWMLSRHGTRHPEEHQIDKISKLTEYAKKISIDNSSLCQEDIDMIKKWTYNLNKNDSCMLNSQGVRDLSSLGIRLKNVYKDIFNEDFNLATYNVIY